MTSKKFRGLLLALACASLAACNDSDSAGGSPTAISGTAATGAPLAGAQVTVSCTADSSGSAVTPITVTTGTDGKYKVLVSQMKDNNAAAPCTLRVVSGGVTLYSIAAALGTVNITPLTDLVTAQAFQAASAQPADAFTGGTFDVPTVLAAIDTAASALKTQLEAKAPGQTLPDIFTTQFAADGASLYDRWLDNLKTAWGSMTYQQVLAAYLAGTYTWPTIDFPVPTGNYDLYISGTFSGTGIPGTQTVSRYQAAHNIAAADLATYLGYGYTGLTGLTTKTLTDTEALKKYEVSFNFQSIYSYKLVYEYVKI